MDAIMLLCVMPSRIASTFLLVNCITEWRNHDDDADVDDDDNGGLYLT